jgi:hypothetical protein
MFSPNDSTSLDQIGERCVTAFFQKLKTRYSDTDRWRLMEAIARKVVGEMAFEGYLDEPELRQMFRDNPEAFRIGMRRTQTQWVRETVEEELQEYTRSELAYFVEEYGMHCIEEACRDSLRLTVGVHFRPDGYEVVGAEIEADLDELPDLTPAGFSFVELHEIED